MILYHATDREYAESIEATGLYPTDGGTKYVDPNLETLQGKGLYGIFGFTDIRDAKEFCNENGYDGIIYEFEASEIIDDPEYDSNFPQYAIYGQSKFAITNEPIHARLIWERWG